MKYLRLISALTFVAALVFAGCSMMKHTGNIKVNAANDASLKQVVGPNESEEDMDAPSAVPVPLRYTFIDPTEGKKILLQANLPHLLSSVGDENYVQTYNGFGDKKHYRIEFYFGKITIDSSNPYMLAVEGKARFKKKVTSFVGHIHLDSVLRVEHEKSNYTDYHLKGRFELEEDKNSNGTGTYAGNFYMDIENADNDEPSYSLTYNNEETRGGYFLLDGKWNAYASNASRPIMVAQDFFNVGDNLLTDFSYGERERSVSEKYRTLGWDDYWSNDEWYSDPKTTTSSL